MFKPQATPLKVATNSLKTTVLVEVTISPIIHISKNLELSPCFGMKSRMNRRTTNH